MLLVGTSAGLDEAAASVKRFAGVTESLIVKAIGPTSVSSLTVRLVMAEMVGAVLADGRRLITKRCVLVAWPSLTDTLMIELPLTPLAEVICSVPVELGLV